MTETLPRTTAERLLKVAEILETNPAVWDQNTFQDLCDADVERLGTADGSPRDVQGANDFRCGTKACLAGWAVRYTPRDVDLNPSNWEEAGAIALGIERPLADTMFESEFGGTPTETAHVLRILATVPDDERTCTTVVEWAKADPIFERLFGPWIEDEEWDRWDR